MEDKYKTVHFNNVDEFITIINEFKEVEKAQLIYQDTTLSKYTEYHVRQLKLKDFKRMNIKITEQLLEREGFKYEEIEKILGRTEMKKLDFDDEVVFV